MNARQQAFAEQYALDHNGAGAAVRAGYAPKAARQTASDLLTNPDVRALVAEHERAAAQRLGLTRQRVLQELQAALELAKEQRNPLAMVAALREAAKIAGFYAPERTKVEVTIEGRQAQREIEAMSDEELLQIITAPEALPAP